MPNLLHHDYQSTRVQPQECNQAGRRHSEVFSEIVASTQESCLHDILQCVGEDEGEEEVVLCRDTLIRNEEARHKVACRGWSSMFNNL